MTNATEEIRFLPTVRDRDRDVERGRKRRMLVAVLALILIIAVSCAVTFAVVSFLPEMKLRFYLISAGIVAGTTFLLAGSFHKFLVLVPEYQMLVTQDVFDNNNYVVYGPGLHFRYPWERIGEKSNYSLQIITSRFNEEVPTKTAKAIATIAVQYKVYFPLGRLFVGVDETTIDSGFIADIRSYVTRKLSEDTYEAQRDNIDELNNELKENFGFVDAESNNASFGNSEHLANRYAIAAVSVQIEGIDLDEDTQRSRDLADRGTQTAIAVARYYSIEADELKRLQREEPTRYQEMLETTLAAEGVEGIRVTSIRGKAGATLAAGASNLLGENGPGGDS